MKQENENQVKSLQKIVDTNSKMVETFNENWNNIKCKNLQFQEKFLAQENIIKELELKNKHYDKLKLDHEKLIQNYIDCTTDIQKHKDSFENLVNVYSKHKEDIVQFSDTQLQPLVVNLNNYIESTINQNETKLSESNAFIESLESNYSKMTLFKDKLILLEECNTLLNECDLGKYDITNSKLRRKREKFATLIESKYRKI